MTAALDGIRILEIGDRGEVAGLLLAAAGADAIRVEMPGIGSEGRRIGPFVGDQPGSERSLHHAYFNANKRGITLDPGCGDGLALWHRLVSGADIVIDSVGPGKLEAIGAGHSAHSRFFSDGKLIWCSITPFGLTGPWTGWATNDLIQMALGGPMMSTGYDDHNVPPIRPDGEHSLWMGGEFGAIGVLAALYERELSGLGQLIGVSMHEAISSTVEGAFFNWEYEQRLVQRQTGRHSSPDHTAPWQFATADGKYVNLIGGGVPRSKGLWVDLLAWLDEFNAAEDLHEERYEQAIYSNPMVNTEERQHIADAIGRFVASRSAEEIYRRAQGMHLPWAVVRRPEDNLNDPHWNARGFFAEIEIPTAGKTARIPLVPFRMSETPNSVRRRASLLGEHNFEIYHGELGLSTEQLVALASRGAI